MKKIRKHVFSSRMAHFVLGGIIGIVFCTSIFVGYKLLVSQTKPVIETPKTDMHEIPPDVKNMLKKPTVTSASVPKNLAKQAAASISATIHVPILMYHYVEYVQNKKDTIRVSLNVNPNVFETQVQTLQNSGYTFLTAKDLGDVLDGHMQLPAKPILLTFDDGHWDFYTNVLPILEKYHIKATAYLIPEFTGGSDFMTQQEVQAVVNSGLVDLGAHTVHHISLKGKLLPVVQYEVNQSKMMLEQTYHIHVVSFAYPNGSFDFQAIHVVQNTGFTTAVSTIPGTQQNQQNRFFLYRLRPGYRTGQSLLSYVQQNISARTKN